MVIEAAGGGTARHVVDLATGLDERGHTLTILYSDRRDEPHDLASLGDETGCSTIRLRMGRRPGPLDISTVATVHRLIAVHGPFDVVHGHSAIGGAIARLAAPRSCARIYTPHGLPASGGSRSGSTIGAHHVVERVLGRTRTDAVIAVSAREAIRARAFGIPGQVIHTVPNGIAPADALSRREARTTFGVSDDARVLGFVGRLCKDKDPIRFVEVVAQCRKQQANVVGVVVGYGELEASLLARSRDLGVADYLRVVRHDRARTLMAGFDVFCLTSRSEGMPYTLLEAMSCGVPVVAADVGGVSELVTDGASGYVVPVDSRARAFAERAMHVLSCPSRQGSMAEYSRRSAALYSIDRMVAETQAVYEHARTNRKQLR